MNTPMLDAMVNARPRHVKATCEHCDPAGYRTDFLAWPPDHFGRDSAATRRCSAGERPCAEHACYWAPARKR